MLICVVTVFAVVVNVIRQTEQIRRVLTAVAVIGTVVALIGLAQDAFDVSKIYFIIPAYNETAVFATFANHSHFGQFMNLSVGAALGLLLVHLNQLPRSSRRTPHRQSSLAKHLTRPVTRPVWALGCAIAVMGVTIFLCDLRGAMISTLVAGTVTMLVVAAVPALRRRGWAAAGLVLIVIVAMLVVGSDRVFERFTSVRDPDALHGASKSRVTRWSRGDRFPCSERDWGHSKRCFRSTTIQPSWPARPTRKTSTCSCCWKPASWASRSIALFIVIVVAAYARCVRTAPSPMAAMALGLGFSLVAILVHSLSDFGQHVPANASLTAVFCGLLVNMARAVKLGHGARPRVLFRGARWPRVIGAAAIAGCFAYVLYDGVNVWRAESAWGDVARVDAYLSHRNWDGDDIDYRNLLLPAGKALQLQPGNIDYAQLLNYYRWKSISRSASNVSSDDNLRYTQRIVDELLAAAHLCPTYGATYAFAGQLAKNVLDEKQIGAGMMRQGYRLAPTDPRARLTWHGSTPRPVTGTMHWSTFTTPPC